MKQFPSRILNEKPGFLGLGVSDLIILGYTLIISNSLLSLLSLEIVSFVVTGTLAFLLIGIRMKFRPKIIRDFLTFKLSKRIFKTKKRHL